MRELPVYEHLYQRKVVYWLSQIGVRPTPPVESILSTDTLKFGAGPLILSWINEICSDDTEKRALLVAAGNDFAYVVQAVVCCSSEF